MSNQGRSTTGRSSPYHPDSKTMEAAKYLRLVAGRYVNGRASKIDVDVAYHIFADEFHNEAANSKEQLK